MVRRVEWLAEGGRAAAPEGAGCDAWLVKFAGRCDRADEFLLRQGDDDCDGNGGRGREFADQTAIRAVLRGVVLLLVLRVSCMAVRVMVVRAAFVGVGFFGLGGAAAGV